MIKYYILIIAFLFSINANSQILINMNGYNLTISSSKNFTKPYKLKDLQKLNDETVLVFYNYYNQTSLSNYQKLFYQNEYPTINTEQFLEWSNKIKNLNINLNGYININHNEHQYLLFQYTFENSIYRFSEVMCFKKVANKYYYVNNTDPIKITLVQIGTKKISDLNSLNQPIIYQNRDLDLLPNLKHELIMESKKYESKLTAFLNKLNISKLDQVEIHKLFLKGEYDAFADIIYNATNQTDYFALYRLINEELGCTLFNVSNNLSKE